MENNNELNKIAFLKRRIYFIIFLIIGAFISLLSNQLIIIYLNTSYCFFGYFFFPIYLSFFYAIAIYMAKPSIIISETNESESSKGNNKNSAISMVYLSYVKSRYIKIVFSMLFMALIIEFAFILLDINLSLHFFNLSLVGLSIVLMFRLKLLTLRVVNGVFGTHYKEAKELLLFIIRNSDEVDFTDDNGKPKRTLLPEELFTENYQVLNGVKVKVSL